MQRSNAAVGTPGKNHELSYQGILLELSLDSGKLTPLLLKRHRVCQALWPLSSAMFIVHPCLFHAKVSLCLREVTKISCPSDLQFGAL